MEKSFSFGVVMPHKMRNCNKYAKDFLCDGCDKTVSQNKHFSSNLNEIKREAPNELGHMLPKYATKLNVVFIYYSKKVSSTTTKIYIF